MRAPYAITVDEEVGARVLAAVVWADDMACAGSPQRTEWLDGLLARAERGDELVSDAVRSAVRAMLRYGVYRPTGRGKPASEFLLQAALRKEFPRVNGPVDANNAVSLASGLPGSIFDADLSGSRLHIRYGRPGESYVFNPSGQSIDLEDLIVVCRDVGGTWEPCGNPVKDSMATKVRAESRGVVAILYVPRAFGTETALRWASQFAETLAAACGAREVGCRLAGDLPA